MAAGWRVLVESADAAGAGVGGAARGGAGRRRWRPGSSRMRWSPRATAQRAVFWGVREAIPEANRLIGSISSHDISLPPSRLAEFVARGGPAVAALGPGASDQLLRPPRRRQPALQRLPAARTAAATPYDSLREPVKRAVHDLVHALGGSVGAEHGVGRLKVDDLARYGDPAKLAAMRAIKKALDPVGDPQPVAPSLGVRVDWRPFSLGGRREGALYPDWRV